MSNIWIIKSDYLLFEGNGCMKVTLDKRNFNTITRLTDYLEITYEENKSVAEEIGLKLVCEGLEAHHIEHLVNFLINKKRLHLFKLELIPSDNANQLALDNAYLACKRRQFSQNSQQKISDLLDYSISLQPVRKAKKNWIEGTPGAGINIQIQPKQQPQKAIKRVPKSKDSSVDKDIKDPKVTLALPLAITEPTGSFQQFSLLNNSPNQARYEEEFNRLFAKETPVGQRKAALLFFLSELDADAKKLALIEQFLDSLPLSELHYQCLGKVLVNSGADGILLLLQRFSVLHKKALFQNFTDLFMDTVQNYESFATLKILDQLEKLGQLTLEQRTWWSALVSQHKAAGKPTDFNDLFSEYELFLAELAKISSDLKLPATCALEHTTDMKSVLDRVLFIVKNANDPHEQMAYLDGLDGGEFGAYFASRNNGYKLVTPQMKLAPKPGAKDIDYTLPQTTAAVSGILTKATYEEAVIQFYRFIGMQDWALSFADYQKLENEIATNMLGKTIHSKDVQTQLLTLVALAATGKRASMKSDDPYGCFSRLLEKFVALATVIDADPGSTKGLELITLACSKALSSCLWESMPTLGELEQLWDVFLLTCQTENDATDLIDKINVLTNLSFDLIYIYDAAAVPILVNYKRRLIVEQAGSEGVKQFDLGKLLLHFVDDNSKLKKYIPALFADQPESLTQFMELMSLVSDEVTVSSDLDQPDSEFEAKVKQLAQAIHALPEEHRALLLKIVTKIDIETSANLPSLAQLIALAKGVDVRILKAFDSISNTEAVPLLLEIQAGLEVQSFYLNDIVNLFDYSPYPDLKQLAQALKGNGKDLKAYLIDFDKDPKRGRVDQLNKLGLVVKNTERVIEEQFNSTQVARLVGNIKNSAQNTSLTSQEQYELAQQITYVNSIGRKYPLVIKDKSKVPEQLISYTDLTQLPQNELREIATHFIDILRRPETSNTDKVKAQLNLLAVLREQYFRVTGNFIDVTQLSIVLMSLKNQHHNMLMELGQNERNSATAALLIAMQWVHANGGTVDVCVANRNELNLDYNVHGNKEFFMSLDIESSQIEGDSPAGTYKVGGINYSTFADLALYRDRAKLSGEQLTVKKDGHPVSSNLILSQMSLSTLDERITFSLGGNNEHRINPHAWIYPLINEFIRKKGFKDLDLNNGWREKQDLNKLKEFLAQHAPSNAELEQLNDLSEQQFNTWINAAIAAQRLVENEDFCISSSDELTYFAVPYNLKSFQEDSVFGNGVQPFLQARLQKQYASKGYTFPIAVEPEALNSVSTHDLIKDYKAHGRILGIVESLGTPIQLLEQYRKLDVDVACSMPSFIERKRKELTPGEKKNTKDHLREIADLINGSTNAQPIILVAKDSDEAIYFEAELKKLFDAQFNIAAFDSHEMDNFRKEWLKKYAGQNKTITIVSEPLMEQSTFYTRHADGFFAIQSYPESQDKILSTINKVLGSSQVGQFTALYQDHGHAFSQSWHVKSKEDRQKMPEEIAALHKRLRDQAAIERHYLHAVSGVQHVVMKQFDEWQAFLRCVYPSNELQRLNNELLLERDDLVQVLGEKWLECLDPEKKYINPYARTNEQGRLQTGDLEQALKQFELVAAEVWNERCTLLKRKADIKIKEGSVDEMRSTYLAKVSLVEQLKLNKIEERQKKKEAHREKKKAYRRINSGLDADGAMLHYADGDLKDYRIAYAKNQTELLKLDIAKIIANDSSLKRSARTSALQQINNATTLQALVFILNDYANRWLPESHFHKKYALQFTVQELLRVYKHSELEEIPELKVLRKTYIENVAEEIVDDLENTLSWAVEGNRGLGYWLERRAVTNAANDILTAVAELKGAPSTKSRQLAIRNLYTVLALHEEKLECLWIFSFGHKNTRTLIKKTRATLDELVAIGHGKNAMDADFVHDCKETAVYRVMQAKFKSAVELIEKNQANGLNSSEEWNEIKVKLNAIQKEHDSIYAFEEMNTFLADKIEGLRKKNSKLVEPLTKARGEILKLLDECSQKHKDLMDESKYFELKAKKIKSQLNQLPEFDAKNVTLKVEHNGYSDYVDLIVEGRGSAPLLDDFIQYNSQRAALIKDRSELVAEVKQNKERLLQLRKLQQEQLPLLTPRSSGAVELKLFPEAYRVAVKEILKLKTYVRGECPSNLKDFSPDAQIWFHDRELIKDFDFDNLDLDELHKIKDPELQNEFVQLYKKKHPEQPTTYWGMFVNYASSILFFQESDEDLRYQFHELFTRPGERLRGILFPEIDKRQKDLVSKIDDVAKAELAQKKTLKEKCDFLTDEIAKEDNKGGVYCKRFESMSAFYAFEAAVQAIPVQKAKKKVPEHPKPEDEHPVPGGHAPVPSF